MKMLAVDEQRAVRNALAATLARVDDGAVLLHAASVGETLDLIRAHPDLSLLILDIAHAGNPGWDVLARARAIRADLPVIVLADSQNAALARRAFAEGALAYVPRSAPPTILLSAVLLVLEGDMYIPPLVLEGLDLAPAAAATSPSGSAPSHLTDRQVEILRLLRDGASNKLIARRLNIAEKTVKAHVGTIFKMLGVVNRVEAVAVARWVGLIPDAQAKPDSSGH